MRVLVTGASGYLGKAIVAGASFAHISSLSRNGCDINCDLVKSVPQLNFFDVVIHAAGKAHSVPKTELEKEAFYAVNVKGTQNLLEALLISGLPKTFIFISSVAVYGAEIGSHINEEAALAAKDPYGESKIKAEQLVLQWCLKNKVKCVILRLPLIAGPNPPGNLGAMIKALKKGYYFNIGGGHAKRSAVLLADIITFLPSLVDKEGIYNLTDGQDFSYAALGQMMADQLGCNPPKNISLLVAKLLAKGGDILGRRAPFNSYKLNKMTSDLTFDTSKAWSVLGWRPRKVLSDFIVNPNVQ